VRRRELNCESRARSRALALVLFAVPSLGGCLFGSMPAIVPGDLATDPAYVGRFFNERDKKPVEISTRPDGQYSVVQKNDAYIALVLDTPQRKLVVIREVAKQKATFMSLEVTADGLQATALQLDPTRPGVKAALADHGVTVTGSDSNATLHGIGNTTRLKALFSDPRFDAGLSPVRIDDKENLVYPLRRTKITGASN
jgi:hypothetical protein